LQRNENLCHRFSITQRSQDPALTPGLLNLELVFDNATFNDAIPAVPEPETYARLLAGPGLVGTNIRL